MSARWFSLVAASAVLTACGGSAVQNDAPGEAGAGSSSPGAGSANAGSMQSSASASDNGALTPEFRATGLPLVSVLGQLDAASQSAVCNARANWRFRMSGANL